MSIAVKVRECTSGAEVISNRKEVLARMRSLKEPVKPRLVEIVEEVEKETAIPVQVVTADPVPVDVGDVKPRYPALAQIIKAVSNRYGVSEHELISQRRAFARPRQIVMYLARQLTPHSMPAIGRKLGGRDHTTILHGWRKITQFRAINADLDAELTELEAHLRDSVL